MENFSFREIPSIEDTAEDIERFSYTSWGKRQRYHDLRNRAMCLHGVPGCADRYTAARDKALALYYELSAEMEEVS